MVKRQHRPWLLSALVMLAALVLAFVYSGESRVGQWWSMVPPLIAIFLAFLSGNLFISLGFAIFLGGIFTAQDQALKSASGGEGITAIGPGLLKMFKHFWQALSDGTNLQILGFVFFILSTVHIMTRAGGLHAMVDRLKKYIIGKKTAEFMTALMGFFIFIDDYANTMIVGSTMRSLTDKFKVSREKLAFLVDATSAPIAGVALVSTWIGYEVGLFNDMSEKFQWGIDGYTVFLDAIGFRFYCFFMLFFVFINVAFGVDYGPMKRTKPAPPQDDEVQVSPHRPLICSVLPLGLLLFLVFGLLWYDGDGFNGYNPLSISDWRTVLTTSENSTSILLIASGISWLVANITGIIFARLRFQMIVASFVAGVRSFLLPMAILILAWSLKAICDDLATGDFIVAILGGRVDSVWLPMAIFLVAGITAFSTGTSWGTMAILIPTVTPLAVELSAQGYGPFVALCLASILDGAIMGDHCSPVSDTTVMSSIATDCDLIAHVKTQLPYSLTVGAMAILLGYLPAAMGWPLSFSFLSALALITLLFFGLSWKDAACRKGPSYDLKN